MNQKGSGERSGEHEGRQGREPGHGRPEEWGLQPRPLTRLVLGGGHRARYVRMSD